MSRPTIVQGGKSLGPDDAISVPSMEAGSVLEIVNDKKQ